MKQSFILLGLKIVMMLGTFIHLSISSSPVRQTDKERPTISQTARFASLFGFWVFKNKVRERESSIVGFYPNAKEKQQVADLQA